MKLTNYQEGFFQYLYSLVKSRGKIYVCENGKVFGREIDAKRQAHDYFERRKYKLLWAEITMDNLPLNNEEFKNVLESYNHQSPIIPLRTRKNRLKWIVLLKANSMR